MNLMKAIFQNIRGGTRKPQKDESMQIYFNDIYEIDEQIKTEYNKPIYVKSRQGDFLEARRVVLKHVKTCLTEDDRTELDQFHARRCSRHRRSNGEGDSESDADGDEDEDLNEEEIEKAKEAREAKDKEKSQRKIADLEDAKKESRHIDIEALIEYVFITFIFLCV
jgi:hypothetical protein